MASLFFNIRPFTWIKIYPMTFKICQSRSKIWQIVNKPSKWQNFAKSGHTDSTRYYFSFYSDDSPKSCNERCLRRSRGSWWCRTGGRARGCLFEGRTKSLEKAKVKGQCNRIEKASQSVYSLVNVDALITATSESYSGILYCEKMKIKQTSVARKYFLVLSGQRTCLQQIRCKF